MKNVNRFVITLVLGMAVSAVSAQDLDATIATCNGCHGNNGVSQWSDVPTIAGIPEFVAADALYIFRDGDRPCNESAFRQGDTSRPATTMCAITADLSDAMLDDLAAHYFELPFVAAKQDFDAGLAATGKAVHEDKCERCHSNGGTNPDDEASILGGQWMDYLAASLAEYRSGEREQPGQMEEKINELSDDDVKALLNYYASLQ